MTRRIRRHPQVREDLIDIYRYIYQRSPQAAEKVYAAIQRSIRSLLDTPGVGRRWSTTDPRLAGLRVTPCTPYRNYLLFFRAVRDGIELYRVVHGARELGRIVADIEIDFEDDESDDADRR
jgi:toxin ParE1/3/4